MPVWVCRFGLHVLKCEDHRLRDLGREQAVACMCLLIARDCFTLNPRPSAKRSIQGPSELHSHMLDCEMHVVREHRAAASLGHACARTLSL